jgi:hypothetical protein
MAVDDGDATSERTDGPTPNGGAYAVVHWRDADGNPTTKGRAVTAEIHEYAADGREIARTYATLPAR